MVNYKNSKIYKIINDVNNKFYIGSTTQPLYKRINEHRQKHNCMSKNLGVNLKECSIILIENFECNNREELLRKEREYIEKYRQEKKEIVNEKIPIRTKEEIKKIQDEWRINNRTRLLNKKKDYYEKNKIMIRENAKNKITCECGSFISKSNKSQHIKTKKHIKYMSSIN